MTHPQHRFNPPPGWPPMPAGWTPPPGWTKPADWPEPPPGWQLWVPAAGPQAQQKSWLMRHKVLTALGAFIALILFISVAAAAAGPTDTTTTASDASPTAKTNDAPTPDATKAKPKAPPKAAAGIGTPVRDGKFEFTVTKVKEGIAQVGDQYLNKKAQGQFVFVYVTVKNIGNEAHTFDSSSQYAFDAANRKYDADGEAAIYMGDSNAFLNDINPGNSVNGIVVFDVAKTTKLTQVELHDSAFSGGVKVRLA